MADYRIRELRKELGYTQVKMQKLTGIDQSDYSKIESGKRYGSLEQIKRIAMALSTSMDYIVGLTNEKKPYPRSECQSELSSSMPAITITNEKNR